RGARGEIVLRQLDPEDDESVGVFVRLAHDLGHEFLGKVRRDQSDLDRGLAGAGSDHQAERRNEHQTDDNGGQHRLDEGEAGAAPGMLLPGAKVHGGGASGTLARCTPLTIRERVLPSAWSVMPTRETE